MCPLQSPNECEKVAEDVGGCIGAACNFASLQAEKNHTEFWTRLSHTLGELGLGFALKPPRRIQ